MKGTDKLEHSLPHHCIDSYISAFVFAVFCLLFYLRLSSKIYLEVGKIHVLQCSPIKHFFCTRPEKKDLKTCNLAWLLHVYVTGLGILGRPWWWGGKSILQ